MRISNRAANISPSATLSVDAMAKAMRKAGHDVIGFGAGEPDFETPLYIKEAAIAALDAGYTRYTPAGGIIELREAICNKMVADYQLAYEPDQVVISCGAKHSLYNLFQVICDPGDEVIVMAPYWVSYVEQIKLADGVPVIAKTNDTITFQPELGAIRAAITPRTKAIIVNSPSNPTGVVLKKEFLLALGKLAVENDLLVISDEIYGKLVYGDAEHISFPSLVEEFKERTVLINGVSKTYAMTGWRIGYAAGPKEIIKAICDLQSHSTSNPNSIAQQAAVAALVGPDDTVYQMREQFDRRRQYIVDRLNEIRGISCFRPEGAFYVFPNISELYGKAINGFVIKDSEGFAKSLLQEAQVAVVPGVAFGSNDHVRLSYCLSLEEIRRGLDRIADFVTRLE
ncbi:MAG: pyridoxal phosphate-dependent aminotransferase [Limnochordia bacterium]|nr:pyridoxal phosphate-dependent aminotransferase [Limnochordia bacterium]MDD2629487.1 pyridoxal phosphate-dependent aminotransferase [Limnochordia bacterium]